MKTLSLIFLMMLLGVDAGAQIATGPTAAAMGGAGRAAVDAGEATWLNPATLTQVRGFFIGFGGSVSDHATDGNRKEYTLLALDNEEDQLFAGGFTYVHTNISRGPDLPGGNLYQQELQLTLAEQVMSGLSIGISVHRLAQEVSIGSNQMQYNGTLGALWTPISSLGLALVAYDLAPRRPSVPYEMRLIPTVAVGANWLPQDFLHVRLDLSHSLERASDRMDVMAGFETMLNPKFALRFGTDWKETLNQTWVTAGLGFLGPKLSFDYAFQKDIRQADGYRHLIDLWMPF